MNDAEKLLKNPTAEVNDVMAQLLETSATGESLARVDFVQADGSTLVLSSFQGSDVEVTAFGIDQEPVIEPPVLEGSVPQGIQNDGTNTYDDNPPEGLIDVKNEDM
jgi:hypothetical protein